MNELLGAVHDLRSIGVGNPGLLYRIEKICSTTQGCYRDDFYNLLSTDLAAARRIPTTESDWTPKTNFGRTVLEIIQSKYFGRQSNLLYCSSAEGRLQTALTIAQQQLTRISSKGPLMLIRHKDLTVAVQKNIHTPSVYALTSVPELGLVAHSFSAAISPIRPSIIKTEEQTLFIEASAYEGFSPLRVAATAFSSDTLRRVACITGLGSTASEPWSKQLISDAVDSVAQQCTAEFSVDMLA